MYGHVGATLSGTVYDTSGAIIPRAEITLTNQATGDGRRTVSNEYGYFAFASIVPATYAVRVSLQGFKS
jgi:protocatechuate 3,4-dioxygenase beta subunit